MNEIVKNNKELDVKTIEKLNFLSDLIESVTMLDDNTVGLTLNKNLVIYNEQNIINITKGYNVTIANKIHLNPPMTSKDIYNNTHRIQEELDSREVEEFDSIPCNCCNEENK